MTHRSEFVSRLTRIFGVVRVEDAAAYAEIDNELIALGIAPSERAEVLHIARLIAQAGVTGEEAARLIAAGAVESVFDMMRAIEPLRELRDEIRDLLTRTPDIREPDVWWPLGDDGDEFKRGARWSENWWRLNIENALHGKEPR